MVTQDALCVIYALIENVKVFFQIHYDNNTRYILYDNKLIDKPKDGRDILILFRELSDKHIKTSKPILDDISDIQNIKLVLRVINYSLKNKIMEYNLDFLNELMNNQQKVLNIYTTLLYKVKNHLIMKYIEL